MAILQPAFSDKRGNLAAGFDGAQLRGLPDDGMMLTKPAAAGRKGRDGLKLLHLGDLHLGKSVLETPMLSMQREVLEQAVAYAVEKKVDGVLLAGDVYDRSVPPVEAVELFDDFLESLERAAIPVLAIPGNHDSPERLHFGSRIFSRRGIHIAGAFDGRVETVSLHDRHGEVRIHLLPFLRPAMLRRAGMEAANTGEAVAAVLAAQDNGPTADPDVRHVLLAHQFVTAGGRNPEACDSETPSVGGSDNVDVSVFDGFDYVALGHLHGPQRMGRDTVRYAGSPLKYSLSETGHHKSFAVVTLEEKGTAGVELVPFRPSRDLRRLQGTLADLLAAGETDPNREDYVWAVLTGDPVLDPAARLRRVYPNLLHVQTAAEDTAGKAGAAPSPDAPRASEEELFAAFFRSVCGKELDAGQDKTVTDTLTRLRGGGD